MNIPYTTFKYKEIEMELDVTFYNVMVFINEKEEIDVNKC